MEVVGGWRSIGSGDGESDVDWAFLGSGRPLIARMGSEEETRCAVAN